MPVLSSCRSRCRSPCEGHCGKTRFIHHWRSCAETFFFPGDWFAILIHKEHEIAVLGVERSSLQVGKRATAESLIAVLVLGLRKLIQHQDGWRREMHV